MEFTAMFFGTSATPSSMLNRRPRQERSTQTQPIRRYCRWSDPEEQIVFLRRIPGNGRAQYAVGYALDRANPGHSAWRLDGVQSVLRTTMDRCGSIEGVYQSITLQ